LCFAELSIRRQLPRSYIAEHIDPVVKMQTVLSQPYVRDRELCNALRFHFDNPVDGKSFHVSLVEACIDLMQKAGMPIDTARVLELGCGPGRAVLELAKHGVAAAHGGDRTAEAFQCTAQHVLRDGGLLRWTNYMEGEHGTERDISAAELGLGTGNRAEAVQFFLMPDLAAVDPQTFRDYDLVVCAQPGVLGQADPLGKLATVHGLLKPGGLLVIGTQYEWPCSMVETGALTAASGQEVVAAMLRPWFKPVSESTDLVYVKADTARKHEHGVQHLTFWERRASPVPGSDATVPPDVTGQSQLAFSPQGQSMYDEDITIGQYLDFHYGPRSEYPKACAELCVAIACSSGIPLGRALEIGGGPGRAAVELSRAFAQVDSGDYSNSFVELGKQLMREGELRWHSWVDRTSGKTVERMVRASDLQIGNVTFSYMDAHALPEELTAFDLICGFNLIDRLARPQDLLSEAKSRLNPGGLLVISSPYTWLEEFTPKKHWIGGLKDGESDGPTTYEGLKELLLPQGFIEAREPEDVCFDIEELDNGRKIVKARAQMTFWQLASK